jgi:hypothetical protein
MEGEDAMTFEEWFEQKFVPSGDGFRDFTQPGKRSYDWMKQAYNAGQQETARDCAGIAEGMCCGDCASQAIRKKYGVE